jgi:hypothetical protein
MVFAVILSNLIVGFSQAAQAGLSGVCTDPTGRPLAEAQVTLKNLDTGSVRSAVSDEGGRYDLASIAPGRYALEVSRQGVKTEVRQGVNLGVGQETVLNLTLQVGNLESASR